jgi:signal transduction histidine kinase/Tfp pilus assembly protein PilF
MIDDVKLLSGFNTKDLKAAHTLLNDIQLAYAEIPHLVAESLSDIDQALANNKIKWAQLEEAFKLNPDNPTILNRYRYALAEFEFELLERAVKIDPDNVKTFYKYALALDKHGQTEKAFEMFERALQLEPSNYKALNSYAIALNSNGQTEKAFEMFEHSLQVDANNTITLNSYGKALADYGEFQKAFKLFERSLQVNANDTIALTSYGYALAANNDFQKAFERFEKSLQIQPDDNITLFLYATVLEAAQRYEEAISCLEKIRLGDLSPNERNFLALKLGQLYYLSGQKKPGNHYFDLVIENARQADVGRLQAAKHILAIQPYSQEATDELLKITENSPQYTEVLRMLSLNLEPKAYFKLFKTNAESSLKDTEMLNRAMYHKILNEISMLKAIAYQIVKDDRASEVLSKVIASIETTYDKITQRRNEEKTKVEQMPTNNYEDIVAIISQTAHDVADIVNNEIAIIKRRLQQVLKGLTQKDRFFHKLEKLFQRIESTEMALNDLKSVNEGIKLHNDTFKVNALFEPWQITSKLQHATLSFDIQNGDAEFVGDKEKIKSFVSELMENALKHNPDQADFQIAISSRDIEDVPHNIGNPPRIKRFGAKKYLFITFSDNGKGIPPQKKEQIFLPLETTSKEGSGLGLFIIKRTLKEMNGHIIETGTQGAHFEIDIPYGEQ